MRTFIRLLALLLASLMLVTMAVACNTEEEITDPDDLLIDAAYDANGRLRDELHKYDLNYKGEKITIMCWNATNNEFEITDVSDNNVDNAIYDRNDQIQRRLNVDLEWSLTNGSASYIDNFIKQVEAYANSGSQSIDIIATYSQTAGLLAIRGYLMDFAKIEEKATEEYPFFVDLEKPWWPKQLVETVSFGDSYYFLSGDISTNVLYMMHCLYINKDMFSKLKLTIPYADVYAGTWTLDKLIKLTTGVYVDSDTVPGKSKEDVFGFIGRSYILDAFYVGSNMHYLLRDEENYLRVSADLESAKTVKLVSKLGAMFGSNDWVSRKFAEQAGEEISEISTFSKGRALVVQQHAQMAMHDLVGKVDFSFSVLPTPKYNEKQVNYYTNVGNPMSLYGFFVDLNPRGNMAATLSMLTAVLECWGSEAYRLTTPEIFNVNMQLKYSEDQETTDMFEYIRTGITFDIGRFFNPDLEQIATRVGYCMATNSSWSTYWGAYERSLRANLDSIIENFKKYNVEREY